ESNRTLRFSGSPTQLNKEAAIGDSAASACSARPDSPFAPPEFLAVPLPLNISRIDCHKGRGLGQRLVLTQ
ncbi:MAG: hypothetical protein ACRD6N_03920, partial [Pyrinomonadaceae bacterium]